MANKAEIEQKKLFVENHLKPLLRSADINVIDAEYSYNDKTKQETVKITYKNGYFRNICVTADSLRAIVSDVMRYV